MFTNLLPDSDKLFSVFYEEYAKRHYLNKFQKKYKGNIWDYTEDSIKQDLARLRMKNNTTQKSSQIDELKYKNNKWLAKYDFKIAGSKESTKTSGNRCIVYIDNDKDLIKILLIYNKNDLPKNKNETAYIFDELERNYKELMENFK